MTVARRRSGFTLLELLLVLAIIVVLTAIAVPSIDGMMSYYRITAGADSVRSAWAMARSYAIEEGRPYRFAIVNGGAAFRVAPEGEEYWGSSTTAAPIPSTPQADPPLQLADDLPTGVFFADPENLTVVSSDPPKATPAAQISQEMWQTMALFLPDGTALEDVTIGLQTRGARSMILSLRAMTGVTSARAANSAGY